jgi:hypothetical protein
MISTLKRGGAYRAVVVCDHCGQVIDDAMSALAVSSAAPEGTTAQTFHVHKGRCDEFVVARLGGLCGSEELSIHLVELLGNAISRGDRQRIIDLLKWSDREEGQRE